MQMLRLLLALARLLDVAANACMSDEMLLFDQCTSTPSGGFNVTLHVPALSGVFFTPELDVFASTLRGAAQVNGRSATPLFRFDDALITVDALIKNATGVASSCCEVQDGLVRASQAMAQLLELSVCLRVRQLAYTQVGATRRALSTLFGQRLSEQIDPTSIAWTNLQFFALLSDAWRFTTRLVLHLDLDQVVLWTVPRPPQMESM